MAPDELLAEAVLSWVFRSASEPRINTAAIPYWASPVKNVMDRNANM
ncbi:MAG TPA: hypothetical protein VEI01_17660 [Terriglobales bacterium]|nr:hypothetical protein [Terriglobales bacterium]